MYLALQAKCKQNQICLFFFFLSTVSPASLLKALYTSILPCQHVAYASGGLQSLGTLCNQERIQLDNESLRWVCLTHRYKRNLILLCTNGSYMGWNKQGGSHRLCRTVFIESFGQVSDVFILNWRLIAQGIPLCREPEGCPDNT